MSDFVKVSELVPGKLYFARDGWRNTWLYCGRTTDKRFVWYHIGEFELLAQQPYFGAIKQDADKFGYTQVRVTVGNKHVHVFSQGNLQYHYTRMYAPNGKYQSRKVYDAVLYLSTLTVDMSMCTQQVLDYMAQKYDARIS